MEPADADRTGLLLAWRGGDEGALGLLVLQVAQELRRLAGHYMSRDRAGHSLQATALVNEVYLRLIDARKVNWQNRAHVIPWPHGRCGVCWSIRRGPAVARNVGRRSQRTRLLQRSERRRNG